MNHYAAVACELNTTMTAGGPCQFTESYFLEKCMTQNFNQVKSAGSNETGF